LYVAGLFDTFDGITIFIAMTDVNVTPILHWLLQKIDVHFFSIDEDFKFAVEDGTDAPKDLFHYLVTYQGTTALQVSILWIDISEHCGPQTLIWFTLCGKISSASVTKNMHWPSQRATLKYCLTCYF